MNLTDHSNSIHKQLAELRKNVQAIKTENGLTDWLQSFGITGWLKDLFLHRTTVLIATVIFLMILICVWNCFIRIMNRIIKGVWIAQKQKGGFVERLEDNGHVTSNPD